MQRFYLFALACLLPCVLRAQDSEAQHKPILSPDKKWEYRMVANTVVLMRAGDDKPAVNFSDANDVIETEAGRLVWAPDSRRFAFNYSAGPKYYTFDLYEFAGTTWKKLPDVRNTAAPVTQMIDRSHRQQLKRLGAKKDANRNAVREIWLVRRWLNNDTFQAFANIAEQVMISKTSEDPEYFGAAVLFTGKCDNRGGWKVVNNRLLPDAEAKKIELDETATKGASPHETTD